MGPSISADQSIDASNVECAATTVEVVQQSREKSASQTEVVAEKIVSGKDGTVTEAPLQNCGNTSIKGAVSTKYVDDSSSNMKLNEVAGQNNNPTKVVHTMHINGATSDQNKAKIMAGKRETNISQNTILGEEKIGANASEELS
mmetsp:Transcript_37165/g.48887  ORF Transcript_37165/g.48887 Transcript_37165/m.48887 type:complete len:144 (-) Transcript_37165:3023-3454(-)